MKTRSLFWGLALVVLGILLLAKQLGILPSGLNILGLIFSTLMIGLGLRWLVKSSKTSSSVSERITIPREGAEEASIQVDYGAGELEIKASDSVTDYIVDGRFFEGVEFSSRIFNGIHMIELRSPNSSWWESTIFGQGRRRWEVSLSPGIPMKLTLNTGANSSEIDLSNLIVQEFRLNTGASSTTIIMPASRKTMATIKAGAASVEVKIPSSATARIKISSGAAGINVDTRRFIRSGDVYESRDYEKSENQIDLKVDCGAGSLHIQ